MAKKKKQEGLADIIRNAQKIVKDDNAKHNISKIPSIIEFVENSEWLGMKYYAQPVAPRPMQYILLKCLYRGSPGNENLTLTKEEIALIKDSGLINNDNGDVLAKWATGDIFRELVLVWGRRCLSEDATIVDPENGKEWRLGELWDFGKTDLVCLSYNEEKEGMKVMPDCELVNNGIRPVYSIETECGRGIEATDNHPMLTEDNGWVEVKDLKKGDKIAISPSVPFFGNKKIITETQASVLGYLSSSSFFSSSGHVGISTENEEIIRDFQAKAQECCDYRISIESAKEYSLASASIADKNISYVCLQNFEQGQTTRREQVPNPNNLSSLFLTHGLNDKKNENKNVPSRLMQCHKNVVSNYLRSLFSADGKLEKTDLGFIFDISFKNKKLAKSIQKLLHRYGILANISKNKNETVSLSFSRDIDIKIFLDQIGFLGDYKEIENARKATSKAKKDELPSYTAIEDIISIGEKRTFDVSVSANPNMMNFVSNGFIVHNSGKGFITSIIALYEAMKLLEVPGGNPYALYDLATAAPFMVLTIANSQHQAGHLFKEIKDKVMLSTYFKDRLDENHLTADTLIFRTSHDIEHNEELAERGLPPRPGSIQIMSGHSNSDSLVGMSCYCLLLDEIGLYKTTAGSSSGDRIYNSLAPAVKTYVREVPVLDDEGQPVVDEEGEPIIENVFDGKIVCISSPRGKEGVFFDLYSHAHEVDHMLMMRLPTWCVNPKMSEDVLRKEFPNMPEDKFRMEFGAEFSGTGGISFFPRDSVEACFSHNRMKEATRGSPGVVYFAHLDPALSSHNYGLVIVHKEIFFNPKTNNRDYRIVVDHVKHWSPSPDKLISSEEVDQYMVALNKNFHFGLVSYDQWNSTQSILNLRKVGMPAMETRFTRQYKMQIYDGLFELVATGRLLIPNKTDSHNLLRQEMLNLEKKYLATGGYRVLPKADGDIITDDLCDALAGACFNVQDRTIRKLPQGKLVNTPVTPARQIFQQMQGPIPDAQIGKTSPGLQRWIDTTRGQQPYTRPRP